MQDTGFENQEFRDIEIDFVEDVGFRINGYTVHCYNAQNGYYSSDLSLIITKNGEQVAEIDVSGYVEDQIF